MRAGAKRRRARLGAAGAALVAAACCLGAPLLVGIAGTLTVGSAIGGAAILVALLGSCLLIARKLTDPDRC